MTRRRPCILGQRGDHRGEIEMTVADVEQENAVSSELPLVERERLTGQEVQRDAVRAERIDDDRIVMMVWHFLYREPGVTEDHACVVAAAVEKIEIASRNPFDFGIDLMKRPDLSRMRIEGELASAEADHPDLFGAPGCDRREEPAERPGIVVIAERHRLLARRCTFGAVDRRSVL